MEKIRVALEFDEDKLLKTYLGSISTTIYLAYVQQFGLSHLVFELARAMLVYRAMVNEKMVGAMSILKKKLKISKKGKGKVVVMEGSGELHYFTLTTMLLLQTISLWIRRFWLKGFQLNQGKT